MLERGNAVVHPAHGGGILVDIRKVRIGEAEKLYYHIELLNGNGILMIPADQAAEDGLCTQVNPDTIIDMLCTHPEELADDYRIRQADVAKKISSGDPRKVAEAVRDLAWREHTTKLSQQDASLMSRAKKLLASMLAVQPGLDFEAASGHLNRVLKQAIHAQEEGDNTRLTSGGEAPLPIS